MRVNGIGPSFGKGAVEHVGGGLARPLIGGLEGDETAFQLVTFESLDQPAMGFSGGDAKQEPRALQGVQSGQRAGIERLLEIRALP